MSYYRRRFPVERWDDEDLLMENQFNKLITTANMIQLENEQILRDIETKVYVEDGTIDDLQYLYLEAEEAADKKEVGILTRIINFIKKIIAKIKEKFNEIFGSGDDVEVKVPKDQLGMLDKIVQHYQNIKAAIDLIISGRILEGVKALLAAAKLEFMAAGAGVALVVIRKSKLKAKYDVLHNINDLAGKANDKIEGWLKSKSKGTTMDLIKSGLSFLKEHIIDPIGAAIKAAGKWLNGDTTGEGNTNNTGNNEGGSGDTGNNEGGSGDTGKGEGGSGDTGKGEGGNNNTGNNEGGSGDTGKGEGGNTPKKGKYPWQSMTPEDLEINGLKSNGRIKNPDLFWKYLLSTGKITQKQIDDFNNKLKNAPNNSKTSWLRTVRKPIGESVFGFWDDEYDDYYESDYSDFY
jgi:hypothetical protein